MSTSFSNIELYYTADKNVSKNMIFLKNDEYKHAVNVMRNSIGSTIYITNGTGSIFKCEVVSIEPDKLTATILEKYNSENSFQNIFFCIPKLKNPARFKFAIEKCVELGVVNFIVFESERTVSKGTNILRWEKVLISAMKQSLNSYKPNIQSVNSLADIAKLKGKKIIFEQNSNQEFKFHNDYALDYYLIFGPEGGLTENELILFDNKVIYSLGDKRLRSETAIVKVASML